MFSRLRPEEGSSDERHENSPSGQFEGSLSAQVIADALTRSPCRRLKTPSWS